MRSHWNRIAVLPLLSAALVGCDSTGPNPVDLTDVVLDFCASDVPQFVALQTEGADWIRLTPDAQGAVSFQVSPTFILAIVHQRGGRTVTEYIKAAREDLEPLNGVSCIEATGAKTLTGTIANVPPGTGAAITMANSAAFPAAPATGYTLNDLPNGPYDLIAHREIIGATSVTPDRVIIRRAQDRANGSAIPVLDFGAAEAEATASHTVTASGLSGSDINEYLLTFSTSTTRRHSLSLLEEFTSNTRTIHGIPGSLTQVGDVHELEVFADAGTAYRGEVQFYRVPSNRTVALGAHLSTPTLTFISGSSQLRPRTQLPSQFEYGSFATVALVQDTREVVITVTSAFHGGTPVTWDIHFPDLSAMAGFPSSALLVDGQPTDWFVDAYGGSAAAFFGAPVDGDVLHFAGRSFETTGNAVGAHLKQTRIRSEARRAPLGAR